MNKRYNNQNHVKNLFLRFKKFLSNHREKHKLEDALHREMMKEHRRNHDEIRRLRTEFQKKVDELHREQKGLQWYQRRNRYSHIFIILFNILIWFFIFRFFGMKAVAIGLAVIVGIGGVNQILFNLRVEKSIFVPIGQLKKGVDEISRGNYEVNIECDVTSEISSLIDSFNDMARKLKESEKLKTVYEENRKALIANISHDLKTPIASIQGYIETMSEREDLPKETVNKYHQIIHNNALYMNKLIDDLFLFSKLDMQKLEFHFENISLKAFMNDLMEEFKFELEDRQIQFDYVDEMIINPNVNIDRKRIQQIFSNIVGNAVKYGYEGKTSINVKLYEKNGEAYIDIFNNGPIIPEDKLPYIFDRFYRVDYARTKNLMSTGLGLAIAKELVEAHGGSITAKNKENEGTCFTIRLPLDK
ncbi:ATPase/histidine kinase/DNA gyrase B/HSP90 domain protein [Clostridiales bacterium oral taxon 876 str. F0540]|nr:ATPase/histidine kinase/DNA gyrase B/HSP90 domain protein [Clostridiales bacterium oral taxon 876 str. F0540]